MEEAKVAGNSPTMEALKTGVTYAWCACGKSAKQPYCDGSHQGSSFNPKLFTVDNDQQAAICMCKQTKNPPYCDGSHNNLNK